jgi:hypothetical protein
MKLQKTDTVTIRLNPWLKRKFQVAKGFLGASDVLGNLMQNYVREFEQQYWIISVSLDKDDQYDIVTKVFWVKLTKARFNELWDINPKSRNEEYMRWS